MSRCFPYPPPGYVKKARSDEADLLAKEKHKEKRNKKEDKEKREGKEKKDKDRSKDKHREKKDRKEKHKDKKKDKDGDKVKNRTSDEKRNEGRTETCNGELGESSHQAKGLKDSKVMEELGKRIRDKATGSGNQMVQNFICTNQRRNEGIGRGMEKETEKRTEGKDKNKDKDKQGDDRRAEKQRDRDEQRGTTNEMVRNINDTDQRRIEGSIPAEKKPEKRIVWKEKININDTDQRRIEGSIPAEKKADKRIEWKEKVNKDKESDDKRGERHKEKRSKGKDKDRDKEKKKEKEKVKEHVNRKHIKEQDKVRESGRTEHVGNILNIKSSYPPKDSGKNASAGGNLKKRKEFETNGFIHENDMQPNKLPRPASSSLIPSENGRKLESYRISTPCTSDGDSRKVEINKEHKVNGIVQVQPSTIVPRPSVSIEASENGEASTRPPHPDSKYFSQILSVPKMEELSDFDDQEWLFGSNDLQLKPKAVACEAGETLQVWAEALQIESADVYAMPYVIPY